MVDFDDFVAKAPYEAFLEEKEKEMRNKTGGSPLYYLFRFSPFFYSNSSSVKPK